MTATPVISVQMEGHVGIQDPDGFVIQDPDGFDIEAMDWADITSDVVRTVPLSFISGNQGHDITDRMSDVGTLSMALNNSDRNSAGLAGYYSPDSGNCRDNFKQDTPVRVVIVSDSVTYYPWRGYIVSISPAPGQRQSRLTMVTACDYFMYLQGDEKFEGVPVQVNKRDDELLPLITALAPFEPLNFDYDVGDDTYTYAFHDEQSGQSSLARICQKLVQSGLGKLYLRDSETLRYISRTGALLAVDPVATLDNTMRELSIKRDESSRVKKIVVTAYPAQLDTSNVVIWQLNKSIELGASESATFIMRLRDPSGRATRSAASSTVVPVADTDFKFSSVDGSGNDKNGDITFEYGSGADAIEVTITNTSGVTGYLWFFQPRGKLIYLYEPLPVTALTGQERGTTRELNMWYQDDVFVAQDIATVLSAWYAVPISNINSVSFVANSSDELMLAALEVQLGDLVLIKEAQTGVDANFFVGGRKFEITNAGRSMRVTWALTPGNQLLDVFILDQSALDVDVLGA